MIWVLYVITIIILDQSTKLIIQQTITYGSSIKVIDNFFYLAHFKNKGAAWSILQNGRYFFIVLTIIISVLLIYVTVKSKNHFLRMSISFVLGGAIGNFIDRVFRGSVVDFLEFWFGSYMFPVFNVADSFVVIGTFFLAYYMLFIHKET